MMRLFAVSLLSTVVGLAAAGCTERVSAQTGMPGGMHMAETNGVMKVVSPQEGSRVATIDIPVKVDVSNFKLSPEHVGMPDVKDEGHIHVMLDGMNMGVLFNFYTAPNFTLPGRGIAPGRHTLIFDLASNTHMDFEKTVQKVSIDYEPARPAPAPAPAANVGRPAVKVVSPRDGATVGPKFEIKVAPANFSPALDLEGKRNLAGYGHYHVFVDMKAPAPDEMMSMAGMVGMPGSNTIPVDLSAWSNGKHVITIMPVQNDHTEIQGAMPAMFTINLQKVAAN